MRTIWEFWDLAFAEAELDDWLPYLRQEPSFRWPAQVELLIDDASMAREK